MCTCIPTHSDTPGHTSIDTALTHQHQRSYSLSFHPLSQQHQQYPWLMKLLGAKIPVIKSCLHKEKFGTLSNLVYLSSRKDWNLCSKV